MKQIIYFFLLFVVASCSQDQDTIYSCDVDINQWTKDNITKIQTMDRSDWKSYDEGKKLSIYRAFTLQQRIDFWNDKFEELKKLPWSKEELEHINKAQDFICKHSHFLSDKKLTDDESDELYAFCYSWAKEGMKRFNWSDKVIISILLTGNSVLDTKGNIQISKNDSDENRGTRSSNCHCHAGNTFFQTCYVDGSSCEKTPCNGSDIGCGFFTAEECNGECIH